MMHAPTHWEICQAALAFYMCLHQTPLTHDCQLLPMRGFAWHLQSRTHVLIMIWACVVPCISSVRMCKQSSCSSSSSSLHFQHDHSPLAAPEAAGPSLRFSRAA